MTRLALPFTAPDLSAFARSLGRALKARHAHDPAPPGHNELLNLIAAAAGHRNFQSLRAALAAPATPAAAILPAAAATTAAPAAPATPATLSDNARKALGQFDAAGRLVRWPVKFSVQRLVMWVLWTRFEGKRVYSEREVNAILKDANAFGDHVTLRRELVNHRLLTRKSDCSEYRKLAARADDETRALLHAWRARFGG
ncbi:MAG: DUF2087 domain-containing protein [Rubrivivax sp.]|nr:DUF2087 domain-containing protein [Rubrivivax sp.]